MSYRFATLPQLAKSAVLILAVASIQCTLIAKADLGAGVGVKCGADGDCQGGLCDQGLCSSRCGSDVECPLPSICVANKCKVGCKDDKGCAASGQICTNSTCAAGCRDDKGCAAGSVCQSNACTVGCRDNSGCAPGEFCKDATATTPGTCNSSLRVAAIFPGTADGQDGWTTANKLGLDEATKKFSYIHYDDKPYQYTENARKADDVGKAIDGYVKTKADVVLTTSPAATEAALKAAPGDSSTKFILTSATKNGSLPNVGAYRAKGEQAWYVAGRLAARVANGAPGTQCIGMILPPPTHQIVSETNAFVRGVKFQQGTGADIKVVIRWVGETKDFSGGPTNSYTGKNIDFSSAGSLFREELLAAQLADIGCTVIAHRTETQRSVAAVQKKFSVPFKGTTGNSLFSMGNDIATACKSDLAGGDWLPTCIGAVYWNWGPLYGKILDQIQRKVWKGLIDAEEFQAGPDALLKFSLSPLTSITGIGADEADAALQDIADKGFDSVFKGPASGGYKFNGQRDLDRDGKPDARQDLFAGEPVAQEEIDRMCWFVEGTWEFPTCSNASCQGDSKTLIPAMVPGGPPVAGQVTTLSAGSAGDKTKYGDVISYLTSIGEDPMTVMNCALK